MTSSTANLERTNLKFSPSILPYHPIGWQPSGGGSLSSNNQALTVTSKGYCAHTYFVSIYAVPIHDNNSKTGEHLLPVTF